jgi:GLPGLI family protein
MRSLQKIFTLLFILSITISSAQKAIKNGYVKYQMSSDAPEMAMMGNTYMTIYFSDNTQAVDMEMMGGLMTMKVISDVKNPEKSRLAMNTMGQKYEITDAGEDANSTKKMNISDLENAISITYDKKDTKEIQGYSCYKANITYTEGKTAVFYITNKITPMIPDSESKVKLEGYPLEMNIKQSEELEIKVLATEISSELPTNWNVIDSDYEKLTMAEFQKKFSQE